MRKIYYFLIVAILIFVVGFFGIRNTSVQNFFIDLIFESQLNNQDKLLNLMDNDEKIYYKNQKTQKRKMKLKCRRKICKKKKN